VAPEREVRPRNTFLLLLVLAALGAYVYWVELPAEQRQEEAKRLLAFDQTRVSKVTLAYPDKAIALERKGLRWRMVVPVEADADDNTARSLVRAIADAQVTRTLEDVGDKLGAYGLETPLVTVTLELDDGTTLPPLKVGETTTVGHSSYVQRGDDPNVYVTGGAFQGAVKKEAKDLRERALIQFDDQDVQRIEILRDAAPLVLERREGEPEEQAWAITAPAPYPADSAEVRSLLSGVRSLRAVDFVSDDAGADLAPYGLAAPRLRLVLTIGKDRAQQSVLIGGPHQDEDKKQIYAKRGELPTVVALPDYSIRSLDKDVATLRDKTVLAFEKERAARMAVTRKDGAGFTLVKRDDAWHIEEPPGEGAERVPTIVRFVADVGGLKGSEIVAENGVDLATYGLADPDLKVVVSDAEGAVLGTLLASRGPGPEVDPDALAHAAPEGGAVVYGMKPFVYDRIDKKAADFREGPPTSTPEAGAAGAGEEEDLEEEGDLLGGFGEEEE
jgi:hypothetical protein